MAMSTTRGEWLSRKIDIYTSHLKKGHQSQIQYWELGPALYLQAVDHPFQNSKDIARLRTDLDT